MGSATRVQVTLEHSVPMASTWMAAHNLATLYETFGPKEAAARYRALAAKR